MKKLKIVLMIDASGNDKEYWDILGNCAKVSINTEKNPKIYISLSHLYNMSNRYCKKKSEQEFANILNMVIDHEIVHLIELTDNEYLAWKFQLSARRIPCRLRNLFLKEIKLWKRNAELELDM